MFENIFCLLRIVSHPLIHKFWIFGFLSHTFFFVKIQFKMDWIQVSCLFFKRKFEVKKKFSITWEILLSLDSSKFSLRCRNFISKFNFALKLLNHLMDWLRFRNQDINKLLWQISKVKVIDSTRRFHFERKNWSVFSMKGILESFYSKTKFLISSSFVIITALGWAKKILCDFNKGFKMRGFFSLNFSSSWSKESAYVIFAL